MTVHNQLISAGRVTIVDSVLQPAAHIIDDQQL